MTRDVGTWGAKGAKPPPPQVFGRHKMCPASSGKVLIALLKNVVQIAFLWLHLFFLPFHPPPLFPVANISGGNFFGALFIQKLPMESGATPTFGDFLRPYLRHLRGQAIFYFII